MKITILDTFTANPGDISWDGWIATGCELEVFERTPAELTVERAKDSEIILTNKVLITKDVMDQLPSLRYIGVLATGYNVVDIAAAHERGIVVTNIPAYSTNSVAQMVFAHLLNVTNNVSEHSAAVHDGMWQNHKDFSFRLSEQQELAGKTIGIVGLGNTGKQTARIALAFGMKVLAFSSKTEQELHSILGSENVRKAGDLDELFAESDVVSLHCPLTDSTHHVVNAHTLSLMRSNAILINTGRGPLIDEDALAEALLSHRIQAACVDVLTQEPPRNGSPLIGVANCYITPHIAWATTSARNRLMNIALDNVKAFIEGKELNRV